MSETKGVFLFREPRPIWPAGPSRTWRGGPHALEVNLELNLWEPWYREFEDLVEPLTDRLDESAEERERVVEEAREKRVNEERETLLKKLDQLLGIPAFRDLRSKAAMIAYIEENFPSARKILGTHGFSERTTALCQRAQLERSRRR